MSFKDTQGPQAPSKILYSRVFEGEPCQNMIECKGTMDCCLDTNVCEVTCQRARHGEYCDFRKKCDLDMKCCNSLCIYQTQQCLPNKRKYRQPCSTLDDPNVVVATNDCVNGGHIDCVGQSAVISDCEDPYRCCNYFCQEKDKCDPRPGVTNQTNGDAARSQIIWDKFNAERDRLSGDDDPKEHYITLSETTINLKSEEESQYQGDHDQLNQGSTGSSTQYIFVGVGAIIFVLIIILAFCWMKNRKLQRQVVTEGLEAVPDGYKGARIPTHASTIVLDNSQMNISQGDAAKIEDLEVDYTLPVKIDHQNIPQFNSNATAGNNETELQQKQEESIEQI